MTPREIMIRAMGASKAWPVVFQPGTADVLIDAAIVALSAAGFRIVPVDWQPIETAPKNGEIIWAWLNDAGIRSIRWGTAEEWAEEEGGSPSEYNDCWVECRDERETWKPKYWRPYVEIGEPVTPQSIGRPTVLPDPPAKQGEA